MKKKKKRVKKRRKKEKKRERKKRGCIYKKRRVRKEGNQLALHTMALHFSRKIFHRLAPPNLALARLQSLAITPIYCQLCIASLVAPTHAKKRNAPLTIRGFATPPLLAHAHMHVRRCTLHLQSKHCANRSCHLGPRFLHTSRVCNRAFLFTCVGMVPSSISVCIRRRSL